MLSRYFILFIIYSVMGWIYESCYCTIKEHEWQNRGFLYGPIVPIYGVGALSVNILFVDLPVSSLQNAHHLTIFVICAVGSFVMEYSTSWVLEKLFHAKWWDYSDMPLNLNGRTCLPFTLCFGAAGIVVLKFIIPFVTRIPVGPSHPFITEFISLLLMLIFGMDLAFTVSALNSVNKNLAAINDQINAQIASAYASLETNASNAKEALLLRENLSKQYLENMLKKATPSQLGQIRHIKHFTHTDNNIKTLFMNGAKILRSKIDKKNS